MNDEPKLTIVTGTGAGNMRLISGETGPAKINDRVTKSPNYIGAHGQAWACDLPVGRKLKGFRAEDDGTLVHWVVEAAWAHPVWHSYSLVLVHLRPMPDNRPTRFYLDGAINPEMDRNPLISNGIVEGIWLSPSNFAAQFIELDDDLAMARIQHTVQSICDGRLSPDTDHQKAWEKLFGNNMIKKEWR